jgi:hypothetical protein
MAAMAWRQLHGGNGWRQWRAVASRRGFDVARVAKERPFQDRPNRFSRVPRRRCCCTFSSAIRKMP